MKKFSVSVVIPAFHCEKTIGPTIEAILKQNYPLESIVVVDDGSKDQTASIIKSFSKIKYLYQINAGPAAARNYGAAQCTSDLIFFYGLRLPAA